MSKTKFKVGDKVVFDAKYRMKGLFTIKEIVPIGGCVEVYFKECVYSCYDYEIEPAGPYAKWHAIAREICWGNHE